jgi:hypothetical protein
LAGYNIAVTNELPPLPPVVADVVETALGRRHRADPAVGRSGGPAGNARLTAWLGLLLLVAFVVECATLVSLGQFMSVHVVTGVLLVALVLAKTATTSWRMVRYYLGDPAYREAGPPPLLLRLLGPIVVLGGLAVLGSGLALIALGRAAHDPLFQVLGFRVDPVTVHQAAFLVWLAVTVPHSLIRLVPAWRLARGGRRLAGRARRAVALAAVVAAGAIAAGPVLGEAGEWVNNRGDGDQGLARPAVGVLLR